MKCPLCRAQISKVKLCDQSTPGETELNKRRHELGKLATEVSTVSERLEAGRMEILTRWEELEPWEKALAGQKIAQIQRQWDESK